jgi:hypothetical protein
MSFIPLPIALGTFGVILAAVVVVVLAALAYMLLTRNNPRQVEVDAERERVSEHIGLREPIDFESEFRPPREP